VRILHFCNYAELIGGAEVYAHGLVESLRSRGHDVALFGASPEGEIDRAGLRVIQRPLYDRARLVLDPPALAALRDYLQRFAPDVVHVHNVFSVALGVLQHLGTQGIPLLQTVHDFQLLCPNSWCVRGDGAPCPGGAGAQCFQHGCQSNYPYDAWGVLLGSLRQRWLSHCTGIAAAPSTYLVERLRANGWSDVRHLPYFVDFPRPSRPVPRSSHELLYVGRLEPEKGVPVLLRALPEICASLPEVRLTVVGGGSQLPELKALSDRLGVASRLRYLQKIPRAEIAQHYARAALCVLPSLWTENSPLVAYECLTSGLPMAGSRLGGIPELLEEGCGVTFRAGDPSDLARVVLEFLRLPLAERERMSVACRSRAATFDRARHVDVVVALYEELLRRPRANLQAPPDLSQDALAVLHEVGQQQGPGDGRATAPLEVLRAIARSLGLPKVLR